MEGAAVCATVGAWVGPVVVGKRVGLAVVGASVVSANVGNAEGDLVIGTMVGVPVATGGGTVPAADVGGGAVPVLVGDIGLVEVAGVEAVGGTTVVTVVPPWVGKVGARGVSTAAAFSVDPSLPVVTATTIPTKAAKTKRSDPIKMDRVEPQAMPADSPGAKLSLLCLDSVGVL